MSPTQHLVAACASLVLLTFVVAVRMLSARVSEMKARRISHRSIALSAQRSQRLEDSRAADNYSNLFELPVLFYVLGAVAIGSGHLPAWLPAFAWLFVVLRIAHSGIQCTYNNVMHRFVVFLAGFFVVLAAWIAFVVSYLAN